MIDLQRIETFLYVAEKLSITEAAKRLHLSQPTVSHQIKLLEQELNTTLFMRSNMGLQLTEAGRLLLPWARRLLHDTNDLKDMMSSLDKAVVGDLRISCSTTAGKYVLPQMAARFCQRYPGIKVRILACGPERAALDLLGGEAHIGVVSSEVNDASLESQKFFRDRITLIVPARHRWASRSSIEPQEILEEPLILREETSGTRRVVLAELAKFDISLEDLNVFMELGNAEAIVRTVAAGYGISFVSSLATACPLERGNVVDLLIEGINLQRTVYMVRKRISAPHRPRDVFWGFIHDPANADLLNMAEHCC
ncbi:MAG: LysR family transcriptional regulator [Chloroflexi bacterium]|nr:MAG: LysR family transcriptional regulator [Chloroflexota bacterium]RPI96657.1 MAG: LysR family transcriptional regulator [Chloroflexota bacterium]